MIVALALTAMATASCEKDLPTYADPEGRLNFYTKINADTLQSYSFAYHDEMQKDTVWVRMETMGRMADHDRYFELQQVPTGKDDAVAGTHYVSFDDPGIRQLLVVKADSINAYVPVVVLRDASLKEKTYTLKFEVRETDAFKKGYSRLQRKYVEITDRLVKPSNWNGLCDYYFGTYGPVRHQFMMQATGRKWDEAYLKELGIEDFTADQAYLSFLTSKLAKALEAENARREAIGQQPLTEDDGTIISFSVGGY